MLFRAFISTAFLIGVSQSEIAFALEASGKAAAVVPATAASGTGGSRTLVVDGPVFMGDVVKTDTGGSAQILFADDTKLVVGPNSQVKIDSFVFQSKTTAKSFSLNARPLTGAHSVAVIVEELDDPAKRFVGAIHALAARGRSPRVSSLH